MVLNSKKIKELEESMGKKIEDLTEKERVNLFESPSSYIFYDPTPFDYLIGFIVGFFIVASIFAGIIRCVMTYVWIPL